MTHGGSQDGRSRPEEPGGGGGDFGSREREVSGKRKEGEREKRGTDRGGPRGSDKRGCHPGEVDQSFDPKEMLVFLLKQLKQILRNFH